MGPQDEQFLSDKPPVGVAPVAPGYSEVDMEANNGAKLYGADGGALDGDDLKRDVRRRIDKQVCMYFIYDVGHSLLAHCLAAAACSRLHARVVAPQGGPFPLSPTRFDLSPTQPFGGFTFHLAYMYV
jgi:hypothetical protein